jgi:hypothetical protein
LPGGRPNLRRGAGVGAFGKSTMAVVEELRFFFVERGAPQSRGGGSSCASSGRSLPGDFLSLRRGARVGAL